MKIVNTPNAPLAVGPYSQAIIAGGFLYSAGQIALDPKTSALAATDIAGQTHQVLKNLSAVLGNANLTFADVVKTTIFLKNIHDFTAVNNIYATYFGAHRPARSTVEVSNLPKGALIEIELIAKTKVRG
jgi:2-iminobutanoate/2-iminopropanoate deaminase